MNLRSLLDPLGKLGNLEQMQSGDDAILLDVERRPQPDGFSCGVYATLMILEYHGKARSPRAIARALKTDEDGTRQGPILTLFRQRGLEPIIQARATLRDLRRGIDQGAPSLVSVNDGGHGSVVCGYSRGTICLADPSIYQGLRRGISVERFRKRWDRWAMDVNPH